MRSSLALALYAACAACWAPSPGCSDAPDPKPKAADVPSVSLRFRPADGAQYREHWIYDVALPGEGLRRDVISFDVAQLGRLDQGSYALRHSVRERQALQNGQPLAERDLRGVSITQQWASDHSIVGELGLAADTLERETDLRSLVATASFGTLIEYPDQAVAIGDSWSIEPRTHALPGSLSATLRPTYTLAGIEARGAVLEAVIAVDIQVDLIPTNVVESVTIEGGGSGSGTLRVGVDDGVLHDARTVLHFSQEIMVQGSEVLGFRELSATAHVFTTTGNQPVDSMQVPVTLEQPDDDSECGQSLSSIVDRLGDAEGRQRVHLVSALHGADLPAAHGGTALHDLGISLVLLGGARGLELDGAALEPRDLPAALRSAKPGAALYVYADTSLPIEQLRNAVGALPRRSSARLVVRDPAALAPPPKASRWLEQRMRLALTAPDPLERQRRLHTLLLAHVVLCEPAQDAVQSALAAGARGSHDLPTQIVQAFARCGCTTTNLEGLEATLHAIFGSPDLRSLPLPRRSDDPRWSAAATVGAFARSLSLPAR